MGLNSDYLTHVVFNQWNLNSWYFSAVGGKFCVEMGVTLFGRL